MWGVRGNEWAAVGLAIFYAFTIILFLVADHGVHALPSSLSFSAGREHHQLSLSGSWNQGLGQLTPSLSETRRENDASHTQRRIGIGISSQHEVRLSYSIGLGISTATS